MKLNRYKNIFALILLYSIALALSGCNANHRRSAADPRGWYQIETIFVSSPDLQSPQRGIVYVRNVPTLDPQWYSPVCVDKDGKGTYGEPFYLTAIKSSASKEVPIAARNNLQSAMFGASERAFDDHMASSFAIQDASNLTMGWTALGLSAAASVSGGSAQLLSAISAAIQGGRAQFNEEVYAKQLSQAISNIIKEDRNLFKQRLMLNFNKDVAEYPVEAAIADAKAFHRRGSFYHGLELIVQAAQEKAGDDKKKAIESRRYPANESSSDVSATTTP